MIADELCDGTKWNTYTTVDVRFAVAINYPSAPADVHLTSFETYSTSDVEAAIAKLPNKLPAANRSCLEGCCRFLHCVT